LPGYGKFTDRDALAFAHATSRTDEALHEWRKQAKYLLSELELIRAVFHVTFKKRQRSAHTLWARIHDLAVLATTMLKHRMRHQPLKKEIKKARRVLQRQALRLGAKVYLSAPRRLAVKIASRLVQVG
jgi:hypothetical protein